MNCRTLEYAVAVYETGSFRLAAERCHAATPTVSVQVRKLEEYLGVQLFERGSSYVRTTEQGDALMAQMVTAVQAVRQSRVQARRLSVDSGALPAPVCPLAMP